MKRQSLLEELSPVCKIKKWRNPSPTCHFLVPSLPKREGERKEKGKEGEERKVEKVNI
jgi:hypothetical protein